ncbi:hypothetical protein CPB84DRAFT_1788310 [Gymnopilus junonius]|uniref:Uncharacterized protein n=1 Tax=Gymnopilus junonius TaxID=109634 RepID=A0A9P5TIQ2_GYMJU|nr:hypothetical protein CPB84DRAFT_1788310 [Gymnopilus junonius]
MSSDSDDAESMTPAESYLFHMANLYSERYLAERTEIPKTQDLMELLLGRYKRDFPFYL